jgi:predicted nuclease of restriction endonuclease-like RecB superfamily
MLYFLSSTLFVNHQQLPILPRFSSWKGNFQEEIIGKIKKKLHKCKKREKLFVCQAYKNVEKKFANRKKELINKWMLKREKNAVKCGFSVFWWPEKMDLHHIFLFPYY